MNEIKSTELNRFKSLTPQNIIDIQFKNATSPEQADSASLTFISSQAMAETALKKNVRGYIILEKLYPQIKQLFSSEQCVWTTPQINLAMSEALTLFDNKPQASKKIHPTALIHATARLGADVTISEYAVIQEDVIIENGCWIGAHSVVEKGSHIKAHSTLAAHVVIGSYTAIGEYCRFASHVTIGSDGFGYFTDRTNTHHKVPQIGKVVIEDRCEFGSHCSVDRATLTETRIKAGSKFDNFCHIAHNVKIGENAMLAAGFMAAGSAQIGRNLTTGGGVKITSHVKVADQVMLAGNTGVVSNIEESGVYGGFPQVPHKENLRIMTSLSALPKLRKQVAAIMKHLGLDQES